MANAEDFDMAKKDDAKIDVTPDKIKDIIADFSSSAPNSAKETTKPYRGLKTPNGIITPNDNLRSAKKPRLECPSEEENSLSDEQSDLSNGPSDLSDKKEKERLVNGNGISSILQKLPLGVSISMKPLRTASKEIPPKKSHDLKSRKSKGEESSSSSISVSSNKETSKGGSNKSPSDSSEEISTKSAPLTSEKANKNDKKKAKITSGKSDEKNLTKGLPLLGSISISFHASKSNEDSGKPGSYSRDSLSNSRSSSLNGTSGSVANENSSSRSSLDHQASLLKTLGGSSDGAVFPSSASKAESDNRLTFNNVLKDKSISDFATNVVSKSEKRIGDLTGNKGEDEMKSYVQKDIVDSSLDRTTDDLDDTIPLNGSKDGTVEPVSLQRKNVDDASQKNVNENKEKPDDASVKKDNNNKSLKDDLSYETKSVKDGKVVPLKVTNKIDKGLPLPDDFKQGSNTKHSANTCDKDDSDDDLHFEELDPELDDAEINESELLLENVDAILEKMNSEKAEKDKTDAMETEGKQSKAAATKILDKVSNGSSITENEHLKSQKVHSDDSKGLNTPNVAEDSSLAENAHNLSAKKAPMTSSEQNVRDESTSTPKKDGMGSQGQKTKHINSFAGRKGLVAPSNENLKDTSASSDQDPLISREQNDKTLKKDSSITKNKDKVKNKFIKKSISHKTKDTSKDKYFLEALTSLESEDPLLPASKPTPLTPSEEIAPLPPTQSLILLETLKSSKSQFSSEPRGSLGSKDPTSTKAQPSSTLRHSSGRNLQVSSDVADTSLSDPRSPTDNLEIDLSDTFNRVASSKRSFDDISDNHSTSSDLKKVRVVKRRPGRPPKNAINLNTHDAIDKEVLEEAKKVEKALEESKSASRRLRGHSDTSLTRNSTFPLIDQEEFERIAAAEKGRLHGSSGQLKRIRRKDLESMVVQLFMDKLLYEHELGHQRDLCKRLEATLEANRKKAAQFHKEVDDLKKVTQRLQAEHLARKNQIVAPVRVKRSVGIQASPSIINKGLTLTNSSSFKVLSPSKSTSRSSLCNTDPLFTPPSSASIASGNLPKVTDHVNINKVYISTPTNSSPSKLTTLSSSLANQNKSMGPKLQVVKQNSSKSITTNSPAQLLMVNPQQLVVQQPKTSNLASALMPMSRVVRAPMPQLAPATQTQQQGILVHQSTPKALKDAASKTKSSSSAIIDLTDDDENAKIAKIATPGTSMVAIPRNATAITTSTAGQFVTLPIKTGAQQSSVNQLFLVPTSGGQPTATLVMSSMANVTQTLSAVQSKTSTPGMLRANAPQVVASPTALVPVGNGRFAASSSIVNTTRLVVGANILPKPTTHPAPLPRAPPQQTIGFTKRLPPKPVLKLSHKESSIVLSWNMARSEEHEIIASYQLYAYQEGTAPPTSLLWKKVGSVKALDLPMACTLTQFMAGHIYHFAVRAVDIRNRLGPFSDPKSIRLGK